jgi:hypothetical protein
MYPEGMSEREMDNAMRKILSVSKDHLLKKESQEKRKKERKKEKKHGSQ